MAGGVPSGAGVGGKGWRIPAEFELGLVREGGVAPCSGLLQDPFARRVAAGVGGGRRGVQGGGCQLECEDGQGGSLFK
eukprot:10917860-Heterocapsa_arctica.AAC.1